MSHLVAGDNVAVGAQSLKVDRGGEGGEGGGGVGWHLVPNSGHWEF